MNNLSSITLQNVSKTFIVLSSKVKVKVLDNISFSCQPGKLVLLTGKNGSGKSTLLRVISGIIKPSKGKVSVKGKIGYYPQNPQFNKGVSVIDFTNYIGSLKNGSKYTKHEGQRWLNNFGISDKWKKMDVLVLSEGMKRRVALSLSFLGDPDILLLDEPLENLDAEIKEKFLVYIKAELTKKKIILIATHEREVFSQFEPEEIKIESGIQQ